MSSVDIRILQYATVHKLRAKVDSALDGYAEIVLAPSYMNNILACHRHHVTP
jgi:hypothetical protein